MPIFSLTRQPVQPEQGILRQDLNVISPGHAVIRKVIAGSNIEISYTGVDAGTGDVTISYVPSSSSPNPNVVLFNNTGSGNSSGASYNGSQSITVSYNTIGAQGQSPILTALTNLVYSGGTPFVKMTGANTFALDATVYLTANQNITLSGDVTGSGNVAISTTISNNAVTLSKLAQISTSRFLGRVSASVGNVEELTATQATSILNLFTDTLKGLVPASGGGTTNFLRADGTWAAPAGGGGGSSGTTTNSITFNNSGSGNTSGITFNGSSAVTVSFNTIGAQQSNAILTGLTSLTYVSGTPFVKMTGASSFSLDTNTYYLASNPSGYTNNTGTVTSVALSLPAIFGLTGSPITTSGTFTVTLASQTANTVFIAPNGSAGAPTFRALVLADLPSLSTTNVSEGTNLYYTDTRARAALSFVAGSGAYNSTTGVITIPTNTSQLTNGAGFITGNQNITLSGDATGSGATSIAVTLANSGVAAGTYTKVTVDVKGRVTVGALLASGDLPTYTGTLTSSQVTTALGYTPYNSTNPNGYITSSASITGAAGRLTARDIRTIAPNNENASELRFGFTSWANNNTAPYADFLHLRSYTDSSGGNDNLVLFRKDAIGMRIYQQSFGSSTAYSSFVDVWHSGNLTNLNQLTNGPGYLTTESDTLATVTGRGASTSTNLTFNGTLSFGSSTRQMLNLWSTDYALGVQSSTLYFRSGSRFSWFRGGSHNDSENNPGGGGTVAMTLDGSSNLTVGNAITAGGIVYLTYNTASGRTNMGFNTANSVLGNIHIQNGSGPGNDNSNQAAITFQGSSSSQAQAGIYVLNNGSYGTSMGFAVTENYTTGPQLFMTSTNGGLVNFPRATPTVAGNPILHAGNFSSYAVPARINSNWSDNTVINNVVGLLAWKNYGNNHVIFDGSSSTSPSGSAISNTNSAVAWTSSYPILMGWNGTQTYGVRVDSARVADVLASMNISQFTNNSGYITSAANWFGAVTTGGTLDWNDVTNTRPGTGFTLLLGNATNGFGVGSYYHAFNLEYSSKDGTGNVTQLAIAYAGGNDIKMRGRFSGSWSGWITFLSSSNYNSYSPTLTGGGASGTWGINVTGAAGSVSGLTINNSGSSINPDNVTQNQIGYNTSVSLFGQTDGGLYSSAYDSTWIHQIYGDFRSGQIAIRGKNNGTWQSWRIVLDSSNYNSYSPTLTGGGASGTWGINVTGNANNITQYTINQSLGTSNTPTFYQTRFSNRISIGDGNGTPYLNTGSPGIWLSYNGGSDIFMGAQTSTLWGVYLGDWRFTVNSSGNANATGNVIAYGFQGNGNVGGTGSAAWFPSGMYSGSTQWLYGTTYRNNSATYGHGNLYFDGNYGYGMVGLYSSYRFQAVFAMGDSYKLPADGTSTGSLYGLAWSHPNAGGVASNLNTHGLLVMENGTFLAAVSGSIRARDDMRAPIFYDSNNTGYYLDPNSYSRFNRLVLDQSRINTSTFPIGHYTPGETVFEIDTAWSNDQLQAYFGNGNVAWTNDSTAPGGYAIQITGSVSVAGVYGAGFPFIPVDQNDVFYMECWIRSVSGSIGHYMGSIDFNENFTSLGGNPGSFGYWVMSNTTTTTSWQKVSGYITGFGSSVGQFVSGTKYWTPQALFNYSQYSGSSCVISGWKVIKVGHVGRRTFYDSLTINGNGTGFSWRSNGHSIGHIGSAFSSGDYSQASIAGDFVVARNQTGGYSGTHLILANQNNGQIKFSFGTGNNDTVKAYFNTSGSLYAASFFETSDIRLKTVTNKFDEYDFGTITFKWKDGRDNKVHWGYSAQEVQKHLPDAVSLNNDGYLTLDYNQAHTYKIMKLEKEILNLKTRLNELLGTNE